MSAAATAGPSDRQESQADTEALTVGVDPDLARRCRFDFLVMSLTFSINHATVTVPILYANTYLTENTGDASNAVLYGTTLVVSLWFSNLFYSILGTKLGLSVAMSLYSVYVFLFAYACHCCDVAGPDGTCTKASSAQEPVVLMGSAIGGCGAGILWTCQGVYYAGLAEKIATAEAKVKETVTAELSAIFAAIYLACECLMRAAATFLISKKFIGIDEPAHAFYVMSAIGFLAMIGFSVYNATDMRLSKEAADLNIFAKVMQAISLWHDPKMWLLQPLNLMMGFAIAWNASYVGPQIHAPAIGASYIGLISASLSAIAALFSHVFGRLTSSSGKGMVLLAASVTIITMGVFSKWVVSPKPQTPKDWGGFVMIFPVLMGIGRAAYESTNKAIFADFFPGQSAGAFANSFVFSTGSSTIAFVLSATNDSKIQSGGAMVDDEPASELYLLLIFGSLILPCYLLALHLRHKQLVSDAASR